MTWLKLTSEALYLMEGNKYRDKVVLEEPNRDVSNRAYFKLDVPLDWLRANDAPRTMIVALEAQSEPKPDDDVSSDWTELYAGIELDDSHIPHEGLNNPTLETVTGKEKEPYGKEVQLKNRTFIQGKVSWFGGANDDGVAPDETAALTGEILQNLDSDDYYCAMRWSYDPNGKDFWKNRPILVVNETNQKAVVVRAIDWGPHPSTERIIDVSPKTLEALSAMTDDVLLCAFADPQNQALGPI
ncbi:MAG: hypothetical protein ACFE0J_11745 [Elainellaceae cyanobacterium]